MLTRALIDPVVPDWSVPNRASKVPSGVCDSRMSYLVKTGRRRASIEIFELRCPPATSKVSGDIVSKLWSSASFRPILEIGKFGARTFAALYVTSASKRLIDSMRSGASGSRCGVPPEMVET